MKILNICALIFVISASLKLREVESLNETTNDDSSSSTHHNFFDEATKLLNANVTILNNLGSKYNLYSQQFKNEVSLLLQAVKSKNKQLKELFTHLQNIQIEFEISEQQQDIADTPFAAIHVSLCKLVDCNIESTDDEELPATFYFFETVDTLENKMKKVDSSLRPQYDTLKSQLNLLLLLYDLLSSMLRFTVYNYPKSFRDKKSSSSFSSLQESYWLFMQEVETAHTKKEPLHLDNLIFLYCGIETLKSVSKEDNKKVFQKTIQLMSQEVGNLENSLETFLSTYYYLIKHSRDTAKTKLQNNLEHDENPYKNLINEFLKFFASEESYAQQMYQESVKQLTFFTDSDIPKSYTEVTDASHKSFYVQNAADVAKQFLNDYNSDLITHVFKSITDTFDSIYNSSKSCEDIEQSLKSIPLTESIYSKLQKLNDEFGTVFDDFFKSGSTYIDVEILLNNLQKEMKTMENIFKNLEKLVKYIQSVNSTSKKNTYHDPIVLTTLQHVFYNAITTMDTISVGNQ